MKDWGRLLVRRQPQAFYNHASAKFMRRYIDRRIWETYFKFCFERNPWDKVISLYWQNKQNQRLSLSEFIRSDRGRIKYGRGLYTVDGKIVVDRVVQYERLQEAMEEVAARVGLPEVPELPRAKADRRKDRRHYRRY